MADQVHQNPDEDGLDLPSDLCDRLQSVELDDDETDSLLQEALALNKRLKAELQRREKEGAEDDDSAHEGPRQQVPGSTPPAKLGKPSSGRLRRPGQKNNPLPPISPTKGQSAGSRNPRRGGPGRSNGQPERRGAPSYAPHATVGRITNSAGSVEGSQRRARSAKKDTETRPSRSAELRKKKPQWNERFSYE